MNFIRKIFLVILLLLVSNSCVKRESKLATNSKLAAIDSLFHNIAVEKNNRHKVVYLKELKDKIDFLKYDTLVRKRYVDLALLYFQLNSLNSFKKTSEKIEKKATLSRDTLGIIQSKCFLATYYVTKFKNDSAYYYYSKAEKLSKNFKDKPFLGSILMNKAELLTYQKDFTGAETLATQALRIGSEKKDNSLVYNCYLILGKSLKGLNNDETALDYYLKALKKTDELKGDYQFLSLKAQMYNYIALLKLKQRDYNASIYFANQGLSLDDFKKSQPTIYCYLKNSLAYSQFKLGDNKSYSVFEETLNLGNDLKNFQIQLNSKYNLSEYYLFKKDTLKAMQYGTSVLALAHTNNVFEDELKALELLAKIDPTNGANYNQRYITLNDSLQNVERATRNKFARIEFETDEITNQKNLAEAEKDKISAQRWMILGFSLFFIVSLLLLYVSRLQRSKSRELQYLQKQQKASEEIYRLMLDQQQKIEEGKQIEKRRISKELHDGIMGKLTAIRLNLFVLGKKTDPETITRCLEHVAEIQNIEKEIRKISHDLNQNLFTDVSDFTLMVNNLVDNIKEHSEIRFKIVADEKIDWNKINSLVKMQVYRILQEALQNIEKYAQAKNVVISILEKEEKLSVTITDDGIGFEVNSAKNGIGHKNMRERAAEINGEFTISSIVGKGTKINLIIPT
ncbi:histidine kinase/DNA gyrase B/HSP90-like ATPase [Flavobacterium cauense R2A-7]|uniref:histidine kinase n=2 Tax=Flavobacterium TaxID=237 RepID=A0A562LNR8_9FLAO|nr:hypothetical protein Q762_11665 [Flavobacterium cauense R2A-7]TWI09290.1 histidine kinase/DNA gyrase B/HSP90-like ATPase [Flavobacterium cauense R2A-7]